MASHPLFCRAVDRTDYRLCPWTHSPQLWLRMNSSSWGGAPEQSCDGGPERELGQSPARNSPVWLQANQLAAEPKAVPGLPRPPLSPRASLFQLSRLR